MQDLFLTEEYEKQIHFPYQNNDVYIVERGGYWEFCMFDWQNKYNALWRIRPIYIYNFRTGLLEHISGGMQHWLFEKDIIKYLLKSEK